VDVRMAVSGTALRREAFYHRSQSSFYEQGLRNIGYARSGKYYISGVRTVPQTLFDAQVDSMANSGPESDNLKKMMFVMCSGVARRAK